MVSVDIYYLYLDYFEEKKNLFFQSKLNDKLIYGPFENGTLEHLLYMYGDSDEGKIAKSKLFTENLLNNTSSVFSKQRIGIDNIGVIDDYVIKSEDLKYLIKVDVIVDKIHKIQANFE